MLLTQKQLGSVGEDISAQYLKAKGYSILERNYTASGGEIDIIAENGDTVVFVEVKTRRMGDEAILAIDQNKLTHILDCAENYLYNKNMCEGNIHLRFDAIEVYTDASGEKYRIKHIENLDVDSVNQ